MRFNDADGARRRLTEHAGRLAAILVDPMPSRAGLLVPTPEFIQAIQETARAHGILVISDEVLNFRQGFAGASVRYGLEPDLITLGKIIGGGFPVGAVGGRGDVMEVFDASRGKPPLPQGGTFSANPISMVAGQAAMIALDPAAFDRLEALGSRLRTRLGEVADQRGAAFCVTGAASLFRIHPRRLPPGDFREACWTQQEAATMQALKQFFRDRGIILPHGAAACISTPVTETDIDIVVDVFDAFLTGGKIKGKLRDVPETPADRR
ncbi:aminotransferase class III-fold pyridoxal phosphate-dependent enzyme [Aliirhizobium terrae]|uniref:aminotransferase class III-fold pyridoxal phosphate-dependent enzyme n=1 Tax=Terrirhizobium terrae TaxID=2926709 RepID=UPI00336AE772